MVADYYALLTPRERFAAQRPRLPAPAAGHMRDGALLVDPEARFADALADFLAYARRKAAHSPRLPGPLRRLAQKLQR
jgi:hypothetical protein